MSTKKTRQARFAQRRQAKRISIDLYLDDADELALYEKLKYERGNIKKLFVELFSNYYKDGENEKSSD